MEASSVAARWSFGERVRSGVADFHGLLVGAPILTDWEPPCIAMNAVSYHLTGGNHSMYRFMVFGSAIAAAIVVPAVCVSQELSREERARRMELKAAIFKIENRIRNEASRAQFSAETEAMGRAVSDPNAIAAQTEAARAEAEFWKEVSDPATPEARKRELLDERLRKTKMRSAELKGELAELSATARNAESLRKELYAPETTPKRRRAILDTLYGDIVSQVLADDQSSWSLVEPTSPAREREPDAAGSRSDPQQVIRNCTARTWTDASGQHRTQASFAYLRRTDVALRKNDGVKVWVALEKLGAADRAWIDTKTRSRKWTSADGQFSTVASLVGFIDGTIYLRKADGISISLSAATLSQTDQEFLGED